MRLAFNTCAYGIVKNMTKIAKKNVCAVTEVYIHYCACTINH